MAGANCNKQNGRRSSAHKAWYSGLTGKVQKKKDRRVAKSSHGKFADVAEAKGFQEKKEAALKIRHPEQEPIDVIGLPAVLKDQVAHAVRMAVSK